MIKPVIRRESARADEREAAAHYAREAGLDLSLRFVDALRDAYESVRDRPRAGSPRYGDLLGIDRLRSRKVKNFPFLVFYIERNDHIDIWRVLHSQRDIPATLGKG